MAIDISETDEISEEEVASQDKNLIASEENIQDTSTNTDTAEDETNNFNEENEEGNL